MRKLTTNAQDTFRVKAYAGTNGVLLAFDLDEARKPGFLGFAIQQKESRSLAVAAEQPDVSGQGTYAAQNGSHPEQPRADPEISLGRLQHRTRHYLQVPRASRLWRYAGRSRC